jgi:hypothetical protein
MAGNRQIANAGDEDPQDLWPLFVKIKPCLSSVLRDLANWNADRPKKIEAEEPISSRENNEGKR